MERRNFIKLLSYFGATVLINPAIFAKKVTSNQNKSKITEKNQSKFKEIIDRAAKQRWDLLPISEIFARVALEFIGTPYVAGTLDKNPTVEETVINLSELDCVTFFENSLCIARCIKIQKYKLENLLEQITFTRYRNGQITDYSSRLHYTSDWILDNIKKGTVKDITQEIGGIEHKFNFSFMTKNHSKYKALCQSNSNELIAKMKKIEENLSNNSYYIIPISQIENAKKMIEDGDIIVIAISTVGLDYGHLGISFNDKFVHASMKSKKVIIDKSIDDYIKISKKNIGITVLRPLEPFF